MASLNFEQAVEFIEKDGCSVVCNAADAPEETIISLQYLTNENSGPMQTIANEFAQLKRGKVNVTFVSVGFDQLYNDLVNEAAGQLSLYDGYVAPPIATGSVLQYQGWHDLTSYIEERPERVSDWSDILLGYRKLIAQYEGKILLFPLDGDVLTLFYRKDIIEHFGLQVPRTWDEYNQVAKAVHGKEFENKTLNGSCVGRIRNCAGPYWANLVMASLTQTEGSWSGHLFDTSDLKPLTGPAMEKALEWMEGQVLYGAKDEFEKCFSDLNIAEMNQGTCVLTYTWGNQFKRYLEPGSVLFGDRLGVAQTPGSTQVLDRSTMQLVNCDKDRCRLGEYHEDIGWVNKAPYLAFGGWGCAVNNYTNPVRKRLATEFCAFASSKDVSRKSVIPNSTNSESTLSGFDPYRQSQLDANALEMYLSAGYERSTTESYLSGIKQSLGSANAAADIRFPQAEQINSILDKEFHDHLNATKHGLIPESERAERRRNVAASITSQWNRVIQEYDSQGTTRVPILETYQRLRGVYAPEYELNQIGPIRGYGYTLFALIICSSIAFMIWTLLCKKSHIVRASQPFFLVMICAGTLVLGSVIIPFGIDDSIASTDACSKACMSIPWLVSLGWTIVFSALFAKVWRVNIVYRRAVEFKRLKVSEADVLYPFGILFFLNLTLLLVWTLLDPLVWDRIWVNAFESYGTCTAGDSVVWKVCLSLIAILNGAALVLANWQAYQARHLSTEYGESRYIAIAMVCILQVVLIGLPLFFLVDENPTANYFVRSTIVFVICMSILVLIFVPKISQWWARRRALNVTTVPSATADSGGLTYRIRENSQSAMAQEAKFQALRRKVALLQELMESRGINAAEMISQAGLGNDMKFSSLAVPLESNISLRDTNGSVVSRSAFTPSSQIETVVEERTSEEEKGEREVRHSSEDNSSLSSRESHKRVPLPRPRSNRSLRDREHATYVPKSPGSSLPGVSQMASRSDAFSASAGPLPFVATSQSNSDHESIRMSDHESIRMSEKAESSMIED